MEDKTYNTWDVVVKILGFFATAAAIFVGITQFNGQQKAALELELNKGFWAAQNQIYTEVCNNAGAMAAVVTDTVQFAKEKIKFLTHYYGEMVLVEDSAVGKSMIAIRAYLDVFEPRDPNMRIIFKRKILTLSDACKQASVTFKRYNLK